jgi:hypothetical protein
MLTIPHPLAVQAGEQEADYFIHTPFYLTPQDQRAYTQEMLWAFQSIHRRFATSIEAVESIPSELLQQYRLVSREHRHNSGTIMH